MAEYLPKDLAGRPGRVTFEAKGYRDVYWCWILNEPCIVEYKGKDSKVIFDPDREAVCANCGSPFECEHHTFICHILKPEKE